MSNIVTVDREFGSGGREFGRRLAEELQVAYYDEEIITEIAKRTELSEAYIRQIMSQKPVSSFPIRIGRSFYSGVDPTLHQKQSIYQEQCNIISELAEKSDCVIVGCCADYILQVHEPMRIFVFADMAHKMRRCREKASPGEHMTDKELRQHILSIDKRRARYYEFYTGQPWGRKFNYDLCINATHMVIKEFVPVIAKVFH